jgi:GNAT superfamily N-acetyltransferase
MLVLATEMQKVARDAVTWVEWGDKLTPSQFAQREVVLRQTPWARESMRTWLWLVNGEILCSCETFRSEARLDGRTAVVEAVASVFTESQHRGRGSAQALIEALGLRLAAEGVDAVVLYSDIGPVLYQRCGFEAVAAVDTQWAPVEKAAVVQWLHSVESPRAVMTEGLVVTPSPSQLAWHVAREHFYRTVFGRRPLGTRGARVGDECLFWAGDEKRDELCVLWADGNHPALIQAACHEAYRSGYTCVRAWGPWATGQQVVRNGSLPMVRWLGQKPAGGWVNVQRGLWV